MAQLNPMLEELQQQIRQHNRDAEAMMDKVARQSESYSYWHRCIKRGSLYPARALLRDSGKAVSGEYPCRR